MRTLNCVRICRGFPTRRETIHEDERDPKTPGIAGPSGRPHGVLGTHDCPPAESVTSLFGGIRARFETYRDEGVSAPADFLTPVKKRAKPAGAEDESTNTVSEQPLVSVGMPVYNGERYVIEELESILAQDS